MYVREIPEYLREYTVLQSREREAGEETGVNIMTKHVIDYPLTLDMDIVRTGGSLKGTHHITHRTLRYAVGASCTTQPPTKHHIILLFHSPLRTKKRVFNLSRHTNRNRVWATNTTQRQMRKKRKRKRAGCLVGWESVPFFLSIRSVCRPSVCRFGSVHPSTHKHRTKGTGGVCGQNIKKTWLQRS